jgi:hypothetical protein
MRKFLQLIAKFFLGKSKEFKDYPVLLIYCDGSEQIRDVLYVSAYSEEHALCRVENGLSEYLRKEEAHTQLWAMRRIIND